MNDEKQPEQLEEELPEYTLDEETRECVEAVLNIVAQISTVQYNEEARLAMLALCERLAHTFEIDITYVEEEELEDTFNTDLNPPRGPLH